MKKICILLLIINSIIPKAYSQINIDYYIRNGLNMIEEKDYNKAIENFNTLLQFKSDLNDGYYFRGFCKLKLNDFRGAIEDITTAINTPPKFSSNYSYYFLNRGVARIQIEDYKGAMEDYSTSLDINPCNVDASVNRGLYYLNTKSYDKAIDDFNVTISINKSNAYAYMFRAIAKEYKLQYEDALVDYAKSIKLDPKNAEAYVNRGKTRGEMKNFAEALNDFNKAIQLENKNKMAYFYRANTYIELKNYNNAMSDYNFILIIDTDNALTYYNRANLKSTIGDYSGAIADYNRVAKINPNNIFTYFNRAIAWMQLKNYHNAVDDNSKAINLNPTFALAFYNRGVAKQNMQDVFGAKSDFNTATNLKANAELLKAAGKIDSTGLAKLSDLQGDFESGNIQMPKIKESEIEPYANFTISFSKIDTTSSIPVKLLKNISILNEHEKGINKFIVQNTDNILSSDSVTIKKLSSLKSLSINNENFVKIFERAIINYDMQDYSDAINDYSQLIKLNPTFAPIFFNRANTRYDQLSLPSNQNDLTGSVVYMGNNKFQNNTTQQSASKNFDGIISDYHTSIQLDPKFYYAYFNLGNILIEKKNFSEALDNFSLAITNEPNFSEAYFNRGLTYIYLKMKDEGCKDLSKAGELGIGKSYLIIKKYCK